ncbi:MAG: hypothetical protein O7I42_09580 [Alphaproteobacteria bacterium]|nr:hypothetical protein [Alphaproteobacteria bacterium]
MVALEDVGGEAFYVDASFIKADVNQTIPVPGDGPIDWPDRGKASRAVTEYLGVLDQERDGENNGLGIHGCLMAIVLQFEIPSKRPRGLSVFERITSVLRPTAGFRAGSSVPQILTQPRHSGIEVFRRQAYRNSGFSVSR